MLHLMLSQEGKGEGEGEGESWDDCVARRTREFNTITRERPMDESAWLAFANFQVTISWLTPSKKETSSHRIPCITCQF